MTDYALTMSEVSGHGIGPLSLALLPGEIAGIVGPECAGKTRLLKLGAGIARPMTGDVRVWGTSLAQPAARQLIGYASDHPSFPCSLTVEEVLTYYARLHCASGSGRSTRSVAREALEISGLAPNADLRVESLGQGDRHRLNLAQAALGGRRVLLLDEMLSGGGLDAIARRDLRGRIARLAADGVAVLITSRDPAVLERLAARVLVLRHGRIVRAGPLATLLGERVLEIILDAPPQEPPPGFRVTAAGLESPLNGRTVEAALALCRAHQLPVRASRVRVKSLEEIVLETHDTH